MPGGRLTTSVRSKTEQALFVATAARWLEGHACITRHGTQPDRWRRTMSTARPGTLRRHQVDARPPLCQHGYGLPALLPVRPGSEVAIKIGQYPGGFGINLWLPGGPKRFTEVVRSGRGMSPRQRVQVHDDPTCRKWSWSLRRRYYAIYYALLPLLKIYLRNE